MRELFPVIRKPYPTVREGDYIRVQIDGYWYDAKINGVVRNLMVVSGVNKRLPKNVIRDSTPFKKNVALQLKPPKVPRFKKYERPSWNYHYEGTPTEQSEPEVKKPWNWREGQGEWIPPTSSKNLYEKAPRIRKSEKIIYGSTKENRFNFRDRNIPDISSEQTEKIFSRHLKKIEQTSLLSEFFTTGKFTTFKVVNNSVPTEEETVKTEEELQSERLDQYFTIRDPLAAQDMLSRESLLESQGYTKIHLEENFFIHILDISSEILRIENGPCTVFISPKELVLVGPKCREVLEKQEEMTEEEQMQNLRLIGKFLENSFDFTLESFRPREEPNIESEVPNMEIPNIEIVPKEETVKIKTTFQLPKKESVKKPVLNNHYDDEYDDYDDDYYSETDSQISYAESFHSVGEYYDNDEHYLVLEMDAQEEVPEVMDGPPSMYETNPYMFEDQEIEFGEEDVKVPELKNLKALLEEGFITKGEYIVRKKEHLNKYKD